MYVGVMPPLVFLLLLEGKANLKNCGTVTMPSAEAMAQASPDIIDRFQAIEMVNLSGMGYLAGELRGPRPQAITLLNCYFFSCLTPSTY